MVFVDLLRDDEVDTCWPGAVLAAQGADATGLLVVLQSA